MGALLWLLFPLFAGVTASAWAWCTGRRRPSPPDHDTWRTSTAISNCGPC
ncbi:hypothetical protein [Streptomyces mexicanus]